MKELTEKQREVLDFIAAFIAKKGYSPTLSEIAEEKKLTIKGAHDYVSVLKKKGAISTVQNRARTIRIVSEIEV